MTNPNTYATIEIGGTSNVLRAIVGREAVSEPFRYEVRFRGGLPLPTAAEVVGAPATILLTDSAGNSRSITGVVAEYETSARESVGEATAVLRPSIFDLTLGQASRTFQEKTLRQILEEVLGAHAGDTTFSFPTGGVVAYRVQRAESDWAFIERNLADAGLVYWFDHGRGSALVIADSIARGTAIEGQRIPVAVGSYVGQVAEGIVGLGKGASASTTTHSFKGFRPEKPTLAVAASTGGGRYESYDRVLETPGISEIGAARAQQAAGRASSARWMGSARSVRMYPGVLLSMDGADEEHAITQTTMSAETEEGSDRFLEIVVDFSAAGASGGALPEAPAPTLTHAGLSLAIISADEGDEVYPNSKGEVRAQHHWDRGGTFDAKSGTWLRPTQRVAPASMMWPRAGWVVASMGHCGSGDSPIGLGRIHDGDHPPSYGLPANMTRVVYKTATTPGGGSFNEMHFEDKKGAEVLYIHASRDTDIETKQYKHELVNNDASHQVDNDQTLTHKNTTDTKVDLTQSVSIGHDESVKVDGSSSKTVAKNETITIAKNRNINGQSSHSTTVKLARKLQVGAALIDISLGTINRSAKNALTLVGGVILRLAGQSLHRQVGPVWLETVGGLKLAQAGNSLSDTATKDFTETIGGSVVLDAGTNLNEDSDNESSWKVLGKLSGAADECLVEAHDHIEIKCGKSVIRLDENGILLSSAEIELSGSELEILSGLISHN